jgi:hypothetical protein
MRRVAATVLAAASLGAVPVAGAAPNAAAFVFGRTGGNIIPFTVTIAGDGSVRVQGPVKVGRTSLSAAQLASLRKLASSVRFTTLPAQTNCPQTMPDMAATFVRVGGRTVRVHGSCVPRYAKLWAAVGAAVKISY